MISSNLRRRLAAVTSAALLGASLGLVVTAGPVFAVDCPFGTDNPTECTLAVAVTPGPGPHAFHKTLHVTPTGKVNAPLTGITITIDNTSGAAADVAGGTGDLLMDAGASLIQADDSGGAANDSAGPITITTSGNVIMQSASAISARNVTSGGSGGNIRIDVNGSRMLLCGPSGASSGPGAPVAEPLCGGVHAGPGAQITAEKIGQGGAGVSGDITITVGDLPVAFPYWPPVLGPGHPTGSFVMQTGTKVNSNSSKAAGAVIIVAGHDGRIDGAVTSESSETGNGNRGGGPITVQTGCGLTEGNTGLISSKGRDPGADLVHLESCEVSIYGVVQSTVFGGGGHALPNAGNRCNSAAAFPGNPPNPNPYPYQHDLDGKLFAGCVEIWADNILVDNQGANHGNVNVDNILLNAGWIDLYANHNVTLLAEPTNTNGEWTLSANSASAQGNQHGGLITVKAILGHISATGLAARANIGGGNGNVGGKIIFEAAGADVPPGNGNVDLDTSAFLLARGSASTSPPADGGIIRLRSFRGAITGTAGLLDARGGQAPPPPIANAGHLQGEVTTIECAAASSYSGQIPLTPAGPPVGTGYALLSRTFGDCLAVMFVPANVTAALQIDAPIWEACQAPGPPEKSGYKFNDLNNNHIWDQPAEPGLNGWTINLYDAGGFVASAVTGPDALSNPGFYSFVLEPNHDYLVCEVPQAGFTQTFPQAGPANVVLCPIEGTLGYKVNLPPGQNETGNNFGNTRPNPPVCEKLPVQNVLNPATGQYPGNLGPDYIVRVNHGESVQAAVTAAAGPNTATTGNINGDKYLIIVVLAHDDGTLGGSANQAVSITANYPLPFALIGCSVTLTGGGAGPAIAITQSANDPGIAIPESAGGLSRIFLMDLHGGSSAIGVQVVGDNRYLRNEGASSNGTGFQISGNGNTMHNGAGSKNSGDGVSVTGSGNLLTDTDAFSNGGNGFSVTGDSNKLLKLDAGDRNKGNGASGILVAGNGNQLTENEASANGGDGFTISGAGNALKKNESNTGNSFSDTENGGFEYNLLNDIVNQGGNEIDDGPFAATLAGGYE